MESCTKANQNQQSILDIGCGTGNLAIELTTQFTEVIAIDLNTDMLNAARQKRGSSKVSFLEMDMLKIDQHFAPNQFDTVSCFGNTIVHLGGLEQISLFFRKVKHVLKPGGKLLVQLINYNKVLDEKLPGLPTIDNEFAKFERIYTTDQNGLIDFKTILTVKSTHEIIENTIKLFPLRKKQITDALSETGFSNVCFYGSFAKTEYGKGMPVVFECVSR